jgi:hypothetical protein
MELNYSWLMTLEIYLINPNLDTYLVKYEKLRDFKRSSKH